MQHPIETRTDGTLAGPWRTPVNIAADAPGSIHNDAAARQLGFEGGWIAGSIHMEQFAPLLLSRFGNDWLRRGVLSVYFRSATLSGQSVRAILLPEDTKSGAAPLSMEDEAGRLVCEGAAFRTRPHALSPLRQRLAGRVIEPPGSLLGQVETGRMIRGVASLIPASRLARDLPGCTAPIGAYAGGVLPANLAVDALRAVEPHLAVLPPGATGLYGGIELEMIDGPIRADVPYTCNGEVLAVGRTPRSETLWYQSDLFEGSRPVARLLMMTRVLPPATQIQ